VLLVEMRPLSLCIALSFSAAGAEASQPAAGPAAAAAAAVASASATPLRGWNSWDAYKQNLNESAALKIAENMARFLLPHGYDTLVIDGGWSDAYNHDNCTSCVDANGRPQPNVKKWPSSAGGKGLKPFIDKVHAMGLKVGMHTLQGSITRAALNANSRVLGVAGATVNDIVGPGCSWQKWGFGVDLAQHPEAGQQYLDSVYSQYAEWGLDL
jgi:alpha-galactosidase